MAQDNEKTGSIDFSKLEGTKANLYHNNRINQFQLGSVIFEVIENEDDGYRSSLKEVAILDTNAIKLSNNFLAEVVIKNGNKDNFEGWLIEDENDGHIWLKFGTDNVDDYYPTFTFYFNPKPKNGSSPF